MLVSHSNRGKQNETFQSRDSAQPLNQDSLMLMEAPVWHNHLIETGPIGQYTPKSKFHGILCAFGSTVVANYGPLCFSEVENSASEPAEIAKSGLFGYKNGR